MKSMRQKTFSGGSEKKYFEIYGIKWKYLSHVKNVIAISVNKRVRKKSLQGKTINKTIIN